MKYLIIYNNLQGYWSDEEIHKSIVDIKEIANWWHYLPNAYIVDTIKSSKDLVNKISRKFPGLLFLIIKVDLKDVNGVLVKSAWEWLAKQSKLKVKFKLKAKPQAKFASGALPFKPVPIPQAKTLSDILGIPKPRKPSSSLSDFLGFKNEEK